ncbi:GNVR domain-containing protein [Roseibium marinum]|uniref:Putative tyrosine kinase-like protein n=1 Tax=Roseibium marinum TaxID=281252 RepID=A0A2S3UTN3_9HYPH|nr:GNVR domain-containing protein [Roseibium marinum]POF31087.1 putative tyrosine kinase-like protein [Roseibium marinum]
MTYKDIPASGQIFRRVHPLHPQGEQPERGPQALVELVLAIVFRYKIMLTGCVLAGLVLSAYYASTLPPVYKATASVLLEPKRVVKVDGQSSFQQELNLNRVDSELVVISSERLLSEVFDSLEMSSDPELANREPSTLSRYAGEAKEWIAGILASISGGEGGSNSSAATTATDQSNRDWLTAFSRFSNRVSASRVGQSFVLSVTYASSDAKLASRVANAIVSAYLLQTVNAEYQTLLTGAGTLQGRLDALSEQINTSRDAMMAGRVPDRPIPDANARVIGEAQVPLSPSAPRKSLIAAFGAILGLILGVCLAALRFTLDKKIWKINDLQNKFNGPCLGYIPLPRRLRRRSKLAPASVASVIYRHPEGKFPSALRDLRTTIDLICAPFAEKRNSVVALVSWEDSVTPTTVGLGLAELNIRSGHRVTLLDAGCSRNNRSGGEKRASQTITFADAVVDPSTLDETVLTENPRLLFLPVYSQNSDINLRVDLSGARAKDLIGSLVGRGKILMSLPPLNGSADGLSLSVQADAVIIVITAGKTTLGNVQDAERQLMRVGANLIGTVFVQG